MRVSQPQGNDDQLEQTRQGLMRKPGADARPANPRPSTLPPVVARYTDWALI